MIRLIKLVLFLLITKLNVLQAQTAAIYGEIRSLDTQLLVENASVYLEEKKQEFRTDNSGNFRFDLLEAGEYTLVIFAEGYQTSYQIVLIKNDEQKELNIELDIIALDIETIEVADKKDNQSSLRQLRNVEGLAIYAAKKTEVIELDNILANLATNNPRQVYKGIAGLNIWESDGAGLQLSIGARGLDPNRTSNFNTRQNGYDISADALGYPESYYTPPTQALDRIEIVRGAASLQYGPQFGGLLNFIFKKGNPKKTIELVSENTIGSFGLVNSFNSIGGSKKGLNYYAFYQRKQGDGWRPNSGFHQNTAFANLEYSFSDKLSIGLEYTYMDYLAQQAGGLVDFEFAQNPQQSKRTRNWFKVNWNLAALTFDYRFSDKTKLNNRSFYLDAKRQALGELGAINRPDPFLERDLIKGSYQNFGNETRLIHRYSIKDQITTFLIGVRYYQGLTQNQQGYADDTSEANFSFLNPTDLENSDYQFPSKNLSAFVENLFNISDRWSITPGLRFENIRTASDGYFKQRLISGGQVIYEERIDDQKENTRNFLLLGLGSSFKINEPIEVYANFSQNFRSINFSDLAIVNPNLVVDSLLKDEKGYNIDFGIRGTALKKHIRFDASLFYLSYQNRIGLSEIKIPDPILIEKIVSYRTNIGDARIFGLESYIEAKIPLSFLPKSENYHFSVFTNLSLLLGEYTSGLSSFIGNKVELIPPLSIKTGTTFRWKNLATSYQYAFVQEHFSDATNATFVANATRGLIPSYGVHDLSFSYSWKQLRLQTGINNLTNASYFTRRATAYPGPGIIPADARNFYLTFTFKLSK